MTAAGTICRIAIEFFHHNDIPFWEMVNADNLVGNPEHKPGRFCFAKPGKDLRRYLPEGGNAKLDLSQASGSFSVSWYNPRVGGELVEGDVKKVDGGKTVSLGMPPTNGTSDDPR